MQASDNAAFARSHLLWPLGALLVAQVLLQLTNADLLLADALYRWSGGSWQFRDAWFTAQLVHNDGRLVVGVLAVLVLVATVASLIFAPLHKYRKALLYLLGSALLAGLTINVLKEISHVDCPWDLLRYGGDYEYVGIFTRHPGTFRYGACFPAGHASAAYAWFGLYFLARRYRPQWQWRVFAGVMATGLLFGIAQQVRGAHFLSHDVWTLAICWLIAAGLYLLAYRHDPQAVPDSPVA